MLCIQAFEKNQHFLLLFFFKEKSKCIEQFRVKSATAFTKLISLTNNFSLLSVYDEPTTNWRYISIISIHGI